MNRSSIVVTILFFTIVITLPKIVAAQYAPDAKSEVVASSQAQSPSLPWWKQQWFTSLPSDMQRNYLYAHQSEFIDDADIAKLSKLSFSRHKVVQYNRPPSPSWKRSINIQYSENKGFDRAADLANGGKGYSSSSAQMNEAASQLSSMAKDAESGVVPSGPAVQKEIMRTSGMLRDMDCPVCRTKYEWFVNVIQTGQKPGQCPNCGWYPQQ